MAFYDLECGCGAISEHMMGMNETDVMVSCPACGSKICRRDNMVFYPPQIQGETVAGGMSWNYYDENLGEQVKSKQHRKDLMEKKGLVEYSPDPAMKKHRDEARYIKSISKPGDASARAAIRKEYKTANDTRREGLVRKSLERDLKGI